MPDQNHDADSDLTFKNCTSKLQKKKICDPEIKPSNNYNALYRDEVQLPGVKSTISKNRTRNSLDVLGDYHTPDRNSQESNLNSQEQNLNTGTITNSNSDTNTGLYRGSSACGENSSKFNSNGTSNQNLSSLENSAKFFTPRESNTNRTCSVSTTHSIGAYNSTASCITLSHCNSNSNLFSIDRNGNDRIKAQGSTSTTSGITASLNALNLNKEISQENSGIFGKLPSQESAGGGQESDTSLSVTTLTRPPHRDSLRPCSSKFSDLSYYVTNDGTMSENEDLECNNSFLGPNGTTTLTNNKLD